MAKFYGGIEGGGSTSNMIIMDSTGQIIGRSYGTGTNPWLIGRDECVDKIKELSDECKRNAGLSQDQQLQILGMSISGTESQSTQDEIIGKLHDRYPNLSKSYYMCNDTFGSLATGFEAGIVLISGTGSNCLLINSDGTTRNCGGWGHQLGDHGGGYWIAHKAITTIYYHWDNFELSKHDIGKVEKLLREYFHVEDKNDILPHFYTKFEKGFVAKFCTALAEVANTGDPLACEIFKEAGYTLGRHVAAVSPFIEKPLLEQENGVAILCVGSVWKGWNLLKAGFLQGIHSTTDSQRLIKKFQLATLKESCAVGAAILAVKDKKDQLVVDCSKNVDIFFKHTF
ncbi:N-acetyl-D-glucosamine kinase [Trichoplax sp. H2]|nr:N-acetyl-D-glucosamine kinase [Trichoplax sp. H2]|eukprot:RDD42386.1 N-acetyl-D-glucosamine kinase [Trichoplax sp. H2]